MTKPIVEITALMLYYGRRNLAEEAVESFLRQTYPHKKLIIVNTHPDKVWFEQEQPDIEVHNIIPDTFDNLNEKYNYAFSQIKTNWWAPWDSDDIWLPWHFENIVANIKYMKGGPDPKKIGIPKSYYSFNNVIQKIFWQLWSDCIFETLDSKGNLYPHCDDKIPDNCDRQIVLDKQWNRHWLKSSQYPLSFIFRWSKKEHGSSITGENALKNQANMRKKMYAIRNKEPFRPHWDRDYVQDARDFEAKQTQRSKL